MNKNSKVLALKYRPSSFSELIGQNLVAETIINSIKVNKVPNAYLFTGIRGVGKTTIARIVAKSLNCSNGVENLCKDEPCENCEAITNSSHIDVLEMDAASKTGVDDDRDLIEFSRYGPTSSIIKILYLDDVGPYLENSIKSLTSSTPVLLAASISRTSIWLEFAMASQFSHRLSVHNLSIPFKQFNDFATILAVVVLPIPLIPVKR